MAEPAVSMVLLLRRTIPDAGDTPPSRALARIHSQEASIARCSGLERAIGLRPTALSREASALPQSRFHSTANFIARVLSSPYRWECFLAESNLAILAGVYSPGRARAIRIWYLYKYGTVFRSNGPGLVEKPENTRHQRQRGLRIRRRCPTNPFTGVVLPK